ncbi:hypothetical protein GE061_014836 [Apolygus lucorum]|uniref:Uncharacterized protein n=1 Tax=Apolygus lucorum TaxID=248454 RepID=A0A8S9XJ94_APOLU|nr:hypothetical protein GE061_014825 [Apolygus lucorum]KAF6209093.1 hypothetical protein GE061_014836 [Apolygus lucorum]
MNSNSRPTGPAAPAATPAVAPAAPATARSDVYMKGRTWGGHPIIVAGGRRYVVCWRNSQHIVPLGRMDRHDRRCHRVHNDGPVYAPWTPFGWSEECWE